MRHVERRSGSRPLKLGFRALRAGVEPAAPTVLVVGIVPHLESIRTLGRVERTGWILLASRAARRPADLVVMGRPASGAGVVAAVARLKDDPATAAVPVLHAAEGSCPGCGADFCLTTGAASGQLARVAEALLELAGARARSTGLFAARAPLAPREAAPPAA